MEIRDRLHRLLFPVPLYFDREILEEFKKPPYEVDWATDYLGMIKKGSAKEGYLWTITFGISPKGFVHCWLKDILELAITEEPEIQLTQDEANIFAKHMVRPDRLGKHFTRTQLDAEIVKPEDEN